MKYIVYSRYGHIQGIVKNDYDVWFECCIKTTGIGEDPIARFDTREEALAATDQHYDSVSRVKFAGLLKDTEGRLD